MKNIIAKMIFGFLPQKLISKMIGSFARSKMSKFLIKPYSAIYKINLDEIEKPIDEYFSMTEFFTRKLKSGTRNIEKGERFILSPVDGTVSQFGEINNGSIIQAKGIDYTVNELIGDPVQSKRFSNGSFLTIYLSPSDYHRIHMPINGVLSGYSYIPGKLFPVNSIGVEGVDGLFTKNERLITFFDTEIKGISVVKVGAFIVGSVKVSYEHNIPYSSGKCYHERIENGPLFKKGDDLGLFEFGSTVILLFEEKLNFSNDIAIGCKIKMGSLISQFQKER